MSGAHPENEPVSGGLQEPLSTKEKMTSLREAQAAKLEMVRAARGLSSPSSVRASQTVNLERHDFQPSPTRTTPLAGNGQLQQPVSPITRTLPVLSCSGGTQPGFPATHTFQASNSTIGKYPRSPATATLEQILQPRTSAGTDSPSNRDQLLRQGQSPGVEQSRAATETPGIIPAKLAYQVQEEPDRLEVQPALVSTELPLPMRSSQSVPHTPATPSRLSMHKEASPSPTVTLKLRNLGKMEFVVPLCMQKRILSQYAETVGYYSAAIKENMTRQSLGEKIIENLNELLGRLAHVATHIGLEGGGPGSQESVRSEQEALYAVSSSEKFKFLGHLFQILKNDNLHIALIARSGPLHDIVELFLKGKGIHYNRPGTFSRSNFGPSSGQLRVSVIPSREEGLPEIRRRADLVIALDESFKAKNQTVINLRTDIDDPKVLAPVIRLIVFSSVEHLDLCLPRTLEPIDRLRQLAFCVFHTQAIVGEIRDHDPDSQKCAEKVASFIRRGCLQNSWALPDIRPIESIPAMDSDSSLTSLSTLSDAMSDVSEEVGRPDQLASRYWPNNSLGTVEMTPVLVLPGGKRPFVST